MELSWLDIPVKSLLAPVLDLEPRASVLGMSFGILV
jgi:hypothetical protein